MVVTFQVHIYVFVRKNVKDFQNISVMDIRAHPKQRTDLWTRVTKDRRLIT